MSPLTSIAVRLVPSTVRQYLAARRSLASSLAGDGKRQVVLLRSAPEWDAPKEPDWGDALRVRIATAPSVLAAHELVLEHLGAGEQAGHDGPQVLVVLTDREESELDQAILARVHKQSIRTVDYWDVAVDGFGAELVDPRLREENWAAEALVDARNGGWPPLPNRLLSRRHALTALARRRLGLDASQSTVRSRLMASRLDAPALFAWTLLPRATESFLRLRSEERRGLARFLSEEDQAGLAGRALFLLVEAEHGAEAVSFGLVCAALWQHATPNAATYRARGRAERWFGDEDSPVGEELDALVLAFGKDAEQYVRALLEATSQAGRAHHGYDREARRAVDMVLDNADRLTQQLGAEEAAAASPVLSAGVQARLTSVGEALQAGRLDAAAAAIGAAQEHATASRADITTRIERTRMALRLASWLAGNPSEKSPHVGHAVDRHLAETGYVDRALEFIETGGDTLSSLKAVYDRIGNRVREQRRAIDREFAQVFATWTSNGSPPGGMLTTETFLDRVVRPVAAKNRVLLLVLDGMSAAIATELAEELRTSWAEFDPLHVKTPHRRGMAAALPTVTEVCRTSLFAGTLCAGGQTDEKRLFSAHQAFAGSAPAAVFHKDDLRAASAGEAVGPRLKAALDDERTHVAVVLNAIDDRLAKEQKLGDGSWEAAHIPGLRELLQVAAAHGMAVLLTSDHGHIVERRSTLCEVEAQLPLSARHRRSGGPLAEGEVELAGPRVVAPEGGEGVVALWDASQRYSSVRAGYHGGVALAEVAVPLLAFLPFGAEPPPHWRELEDQQPSWWSLEDAPGSVASGRDTPPAATPAASATKKTKRPVPAPPRQSTALFHLDQAEEESTDTSRGPANARDEPLAVDEGSKAWPEALAAKLDASETFRAQRASIGGRPLGDKPLKAVQVLLEAGGTLPSSALAQRIGDSPTRGQGFAAVLRRLLNYDGVQVLETLPDGRTLRLHAPLLIEQFGLD